MSQYRPYRDYAYLLVKATEYRRMAARIDQPEVAGRLRAVAQSYEERFAAVRAEALFRRAMTQRAGPPAASARSSLS
jgi:hypothetical protein